MSNTFCELLLVWGAGVQAIALTFGLAALGVGFIDLRPTPVGKALGRPRLMAAGTTAIAVGGAAWAVLETLVRHWPC